MASPRLRAELRFLLTVAAWALWAGAGEDQAGEALQKRLAQEGVRFPPGAWVRYDEPTGNLILHTTPDALATARALLYQPRYPQPAPPPEPFTVSVSLLVLPNASAGACGLSESTSAKVSAGDALHRLLDEASRRRGGKPLPGVAVAAFSATEAARARPLLLALPGAQVLASATATGRVDNGVSAEDGATVVLDRRAGYHAFEGTKLLVTVSRAEGQALTLQLGFTWTALLEAPQPASAVGVGVCPGLGRIDVEGMLTMEPGTLALLRCQPWLDSPVDDSQILQDLHRRQWEDKDVFALVHCAATLRPGEKPGGRELLRALDRLRRGGDDGDDDDDDDDY